MSSETYSVIRFWFNDPRERVRSGLTLEEAQEHCRRDDTKGLDWFDGYESETRCSSPNEPAAPHEWSTCGSCGRTWDDAHVTSITPTPAGRCPYEYEHVYEGRDD